LLISADDLAGTDVAQRLQSPVPVYYFMIFG